MGSTGDSAIGSQDSLEKDEHSPAANHTDNHKDEDLPDYANIQDIHDAKNKKVRYLYDIKHTYNQQIKAHLP